MKVFYKVVKKVKCGGNLVTTNEPPKTHQQVELVDKPFLVTEFQQPWYWCDHCQCFHAAELPPEIRKSGLFGPKLIALTAYLKGRGHMSYKTVQQFFFDTYLSDLMEIMRQRQMLDLDQTGQKVESVTFTELIWDDGEIFDDEWLDFSEQPEEADFWSGLFDDDPLVSCPLPLA